MKKIVKILPLDSRNTLQTEGLELFQDYPERFVLGSDTFYGEPKTYVLERTEYFFSQLPEGISQRIACTNAKEIYSLQVEC